MAPLEEECLQIQTKGAARVPWKSSKKPVKFASFVYFRIISYVAKNWTHQRYQVSFHIALRVELPTGLPRKLTHSIYYLHLFYLSNYRFGCARIDTLFWHRISRDKRSDSISHSVSTTFELYWSILCLFSSFTRQLFTRSLATTRRLRIAHTTMALLVVHALQIERVWVWLELPRLNWLQLYIEFHVLSVVTCHLRWICQCILQSLNKKGFLFFVVVVVVVFSAVNKSDSCVLPYQIGIWSEIKLCARADAKSGDNEW